LNLFYQLEIIFPTMKNFLSSDKLIIGSGLGLSFLF
jgi:hypothetical protein